MARLILAAAIWPRSGGDMAAAPARCASPVLAAVLVRGLQTVCGDAAGIEWLRSALARCD